MNLTRRPCPRCRQTLPLDDFALVPAGSGPRTLSALCARCENQSRAVAAMREAAIRITTRSDQRIGGKSNRPPDKGCALAPACLSCPLPACIWDTPEGDRATVREIWRPVRAR